MAQFFGKLSRHTRHDNTEIPEFLRTHPLSYNRVAESEARASEYPSKNPGNSFEYYLAKAKIQALYTDRRDDPKLYFKDQMESGQLEVSDAARYGIGIDFTQSRQFEKARSILTPLLSRHPHNLWIHSALAQIDLADNRETQAIDRYKMLIDKNPEKTYLSYYLINAYIVNQQTILAKILIRYQIRRHPELYRLYKLLSKVNATLGSLAEAHQADAEYHATLGDFYSAIASLKFALRESGTEGYLAQSISARLSDLEDKLLLQKKVRKG
jgi:predicted Zn-dependent protease